MEKIASGNSLLNPLEVLNTANLGYGETVADMGTGAQGHFTLQAAKMVGDKGHVYGIDILKSVLQNIDSRAKHEGLTNITTVWSNLEVVGGAKKIIDHSVDIALLINVFFQTGEHRENIFKEAKRILKKGGRMVVIDWKTTGSPVGPPLDMRIDLENMKTMLLSNGFKIQKEFRPGDHHWGVIVSS